MPLVSAGLIAFLLNAAMQITIVCAGTAVALSILRSAPPRVKHRIAVIGLALCALVPVFGAWSVHDAGGSTAIIIARVDARPLATDGLVVTFVYGYIAVLTWKMFTLARAVTAAVLLRRTCTPIADGPIVESFHRLSTDGRIQLRRSTTSITPLVLGCVNPIIVVSDALASGDAAVIDTVIAHECAHVVRHDVPVAATIELLTAPFALHPALVMLKRAAAKYRELACDEDAIGRLRITRHAYAAALLRVAEHGVEPVAVGASVASHLEERVRELLEHRSDRVGMLRRACGYASVIGTLAIAPFSTIAIDGGWRNLSGVWTLDVDRSEPHGHLPFQSAQMQIDTTGRHLLIAQERTQANGHVERFEINGTTDDVPFKVHLPGSAAMQTRARWQGERLITDAFGPGRRYREHGEAVANGNQLVIDAENAYDNERTRYRLVFRRQ